MESIMVVFSSTDIPDELIENAVKLAKERKSSLVILDVRDKKMSERVGYLTENLGFMGDKVVGRLKKEISNERCDVIYKRLSILEQKANKNNVPYEIVVEKGPFIDSVVKVARAKKVSTIIGQDVEKLPKEFKVIRV
jgi:hypothetical protein